MAIDVEGAIKCFYKYIRNKRRAKESVYPLLDVRRNLVTEDEQKAEVLYTFFASVSNSETNCSAGTQPPELENRDKEQNEVPIIQEEMISDLLHHLDTHILWGEW